MPPPFCPLAVLFLSLTPAPLPVEICMVIKVVPYSGRHFRNAGSENNFSQYWATNIALAGCVAMVTVTDTLLLDVSKGKLQPPICTFECCHRRLAMNRRFEVFVLL